MAKGSHSGWDGRPPARRFCDVCGGKLTLKEHLWFDHFNDQVFHHACKVKAMKEARQ